MRSSPHASSLFSDALSASTSLFFEKTKTWAFDLVGREAVGRAWWVLTPSEPPSPARVSVAPTLPSISPPLSPSHFPPPPSALPAAPAPKFLSLAIAFFFSLAPAFDCAGIPVACECRRRSRLHFPQTANQCPLPNISSLPLPLRFIVSFFFKNMSGLFSRCRRLVPRLRLLPLKISPPCRLRLRGAGAGGTEGGGGGVQGGDHLRAGRARRRNCCFHDLQASGLRAGAPPRPPRAHPSPAILPHDPTPL